MDRPFGVAKRRRACAPTKLAEVANAGGEEEEEKLVYKDNLSSFERAVKKRRKAYQAETAYIPERTLNGLVLTLSGSVLEQPRDGIFEVDAILGTRITQTRVMSR